MKIPAPVREVFARMQEAGFEVYLVGGCVRDLLRGEKPKDWDFTTSAMPDQIQNLFPKNFYANNFGTVTVLTESEDATLKEIEITPYRMETSYSDKRHPDAIKFGVSLEEDLARRDFTVNAIALGLDGAGKKFFIDPFEGRADINRKLIRAVGEAEERFSEDALRLMRAVRLATQLGFSIEPDTYKAAEKLAPSLKDISMERVRDELVKIIEDVRAGWGIETLREVGLMKFVIPELLEGWNISQNKHHIYSVWEHNLRALEYAVSQNYDTDVRLAALLHDVAKPRTKHGEGPQATFYGHDVVGAKMTARILERLRFPKKTIERIIKLVRWHLFQYEVDVVGESSVRRLVREVGPENIEDLVRVRICDRIGSGVPKAVPYRLRHFQYMVEKVLHDPISVKMLKINGEDIMKTLGVKPGPRIGLILSALLGEVLEDPKLNTGEYLIHRAQEMKDWQDTQFEELIAKGKEIILETEEAEKKKFYL